MNFLFSIIVGLILYGCVSSATFVKDISSLKEKVVVKESDNFDFDVNHVVRVRDPVQRQLNWVNAAAARGGRITIVQGATILDPARMIIAVLTPAMLGTGSGPGVTIPNMAEFQTRFAGKGARCHIIGAQLGGAGNVQANLFPCFQNRFNTPAMTLYEGKVATKLREGQTVTFAVELNYGTNFYPDSVTMTAIANGRTLFRAELENTEDAGVTVFERAFE